MNAARNGKTDVAPLYLNTPLGGEEAAELARKLYVVLDSRLPVRLNELSDRPEGSLANPLKPDEDVVGTISTGGGQFGLIVERIAAPGQGSVWLFARTTLESIPDIHDEVNLVHVDRYLPEFVGRPRLGGIRLFEWLILLVIVPLCYRLLALSSLVGPVRALRSRRGTPDTGPWYLPGPVRLFILAVAIRWIYTSVDLPLRERQFWTIAVALLAVGAAVWAVLKLNAFGEDYIRRHYQVSRLGEVAAPLRLGRRVADVLAVLVGLLVLLGLFGVDATAALAGLGIGGIAIALAAQKTLENVIGGLSLIFDKAVRVGDFLKLGETLGTVDEIGLRSTRIRTLDRTIVSVPNGQVASVNVETLSVRDKYWFRHVVGLQYGTTAAQIRAVIEGTERLLIDYRGVERESVRVRFFRLGSFSLDVEVVAYVFTADWAAFLAIQQDLLLRLMEIVEQSGTAIAFPSQTLHVVDERAAHASRDGVLLPREDESHQPQSHATRKAG
jgi:MscS family membrane protein